MIKQDILRRQSKKRVRAMFRALWPTELRERWPKWTREAIDQAETMAAESYVQGFEDAATEIRMMLEAFGAKKER